MKKIIMTLFLAFALIGLVSAEGCSPTINLLSQDPYPAVPGEYVKLVFQVSDIDNPLCENFYFELLDAYPIEFDGSSDNSVLLGAGKYLVNFNSYALIPFKVRVNNTAIDGDNEIWARYAYNYNGVNSSNGSFSLKKFDLTVNNTRADFELSVKDYDSATSIVTFGILNIGKNEVEGMTVDLMKQANFDVKGNTRSIIGSLDSNDDTTFTFEGYPSEGEITVLIRYTDKIGIRREIEKKVTFDPSLYEGRKKDEKQTNYAGFVILIIIVALIVFWVVSRRSKRKKLEKAQMLALKRR